MMLQFLDNLQNQDLSFVFPKTRYIYKSISGGRSRDILIPGANAAYRPIKVQDRACKQQGQKS